MRQELIVRASELERAAEQVMPADNIQARSSKVASARYSGFSDQYINGAWRPGGTRRALSDTDPYTSETLTEIALGDRQDVEDAYQAASKAQLAWAQALPGQRA